MSVRDLMQSFAIPPWEIEQAAELRWLRIVTRRPSGRGRPSRVAELRDEKNAKLPKPRRQIEPEISTRHWLFAMRAAKKCCPGGMRAFGFNIPGIVTAYIETYQPKSRRGEGERIPIGCGVHTSKRQCSGSTHRWRGRLHEMSRCRKPFQEFGQGWPSLDAGRRVCFEVLARAVIDQTA